MLLLSVFFCEVVARVHWHKSQFSAYTINVWLKAQEKLLSSVVSSRHGVETCVPVSRESDPSGTDGKGGSWFACEGTGVSTGGRVHSSPLFFVERTKESNTCVQVFFFFEIAWIHARRTTDRDLKSQRHEKVNAWIRARQTTHHDLGSVIPEQTL